MAQPTIYACWTSVTCCWSTARLNNLLLMRKEISVVDAPARRRISDRVGLGVMSSDRFWRIVNTKRPSRLKNMEIQTMRIVRILSSMFACGLFCMGCVLIWFGSEIRRVESAQYDSQGQARSEASASPLVNKKQCRRALKVRNTIGSYFALS